MSNQVIFLITAAVVALVVWGWMRLAYLGRAPSKQHQALSDGEKREQMALELVLVVVCIILFLWWKQP